MRKVTEAVCANMVAPADVFTTATEHCRAAVNTSSSAWRQCVHVLPGSTESPGERSVGRGTEGHAGEKH